MKYLLGTGRYNVSEAWSKIWDYNDPDIEPSEIALIEVGSKSLRAGYNEFITEGNLGHVGDLLNGAKPHAFCGWSAAFIQLAMAAYCAELDFIYKEQDCLAFGPWVETMYRDIGDGGMVFGGKMKTAPYMPCAQSLVLIKHEFIPHFVWRYLGMGRDGVENNLPEHKFAAMLNSEPHHFKTLSFGYDRERPIDFDAKVWYAQKFTQKELDELKRRKMI